jgi:hypothetical protein
MRFINCILSGQAFFQCLFHLVISLLITLWTQYSISILDLLLKLRGFYAIWFLYLLWFRRCRIEIGVDFRFTISIFIVLLLGQVFDSVLPFVKLSAVLKHHIQPLTVPF